MQQEHHISIKHISLAKEAKADEMVEKEIQGIWPFSLIWQMLRDNW
ncbi:hypothetical protein [Pedobacter glucosidilyticus]|nr:hypothetical protein [Pedobacter glucosidilyticus]